LVLVVVDIENPYNTMSGSHLSKDLYDLIKSIGDSRSKQEEDKIIRNEAKQLIERFKSKSISDKQMKEYLISSIYVELLGHNASFAHIPAINSTQSKSIKMKRLAYLACTLFLNNRNNAQILLVATLQKDLQSKIDQEVGAALVTLCKIINISILEAVMEPVYKLLTHKNSWIRKKAVIVCHRFFILNPSLIDDLDPKMNTALCDKDPCVMAASLNYFYAAIRANPNRYKDLVPSFVIILKQVIEHRLPKEYDFHRMPAPWIQMQILGILGLLGQYDQKASEGMYEVLGMVMRRADDLGINIGYAIVYQCLRTIITIYPYKSLLELAANTISRFLNTDNKNLKYVGITGLSLIVTVNPDYVLKHQNSVIECLEDTDVTLKAKSIDLLYKMTNHKNVNAIVEKFLNYLRTASTDSPIRKDLVTKINQLAERFVTNKTWFINTVNKLFEISGDLVPSEMTNNFIRVLIDWGEDDEVATFRTYAINLYLGILKTSVAISDALMEVMSFALGFYGSMAINDLNEIIGVIQLLCKWTEYPFNNERTKGIILNAVMKLHRAINYHPLHEVDSLLQKFSRSKNPELAQCALEHLRFIAKPELNAAIQENIVEDPDETLSFLDKYVEQAGGERYDPSKSFSNVKSQEPKLNMQPYRLPDRIYSVRKGDGPMIGQVNVETKLIVNVPKVIGEEGYLGKVPGTTMPTAGSISKPTAKPSQPQETLKTTKEKLIKKPKKEEPVKQVLFQDDIFSGIGEMPVPSKSEDKPAVSQPVFSPPTTTQTTKVTDLLGMNDEEETKTEGKADLTELSEVFGFKEQKKPLVTPLNIEIDDFGNKWGTYENLLSESIVDKKTLTTKEIAMKLKGHGFHSVSLLEFEGVLAGTLNDCVVLLHYMQSDGSILFNLKTSKSLPQAAEILRTITSSIY
jgi:AP-4 complex subunit epsilon-1